MKLSVPCLAVVMTVLCRSAEALDFDGDIDAAAALDSARAAASALEGGAAESSRVGAPDFEAAFLPSASFEAPDAGAKRSPYACSFHWFRAPDGSIIGLDIIRSEDTGTLALRAYRQDAGGSLKGMIHEAPLERWAPFGAGKRPDLRSGPNVLGRGRNWVAGAVREPARGMDVVFDLEIAPLSPGRGSGRLGPLFVHLAATDYASVRVRGWLAFDGSRIEIDSEGIASVHYGARLPQAAYVATVPGGGDASSILLVAARSDNLRAGGELLAGRSLIYSYGSGDVPAFSGGVGTFGRRIPLGLGTSLIVVPESAFEHRLLGEPTVTGLAGAWLEKWSLNGASLPRRQTVYLGQVIFDYRGAEYLEVLR